MADAEQSDVMSLTVALLSAYFANNTVPSSELPGLVEGTRKALLGGTPALTSAAEEKVSAPLAAEPTAVAPMPVPEFEPAVSIETSLASPDQILSMIDGKPYKALKRHLATHGLTPAEYRARYDLPADYPVVAPGYSAARREVALKLGLGGKRKPVAADLKPTPADSIAPAAEQAPAEVVADKPAPARKVRGKATKSPVPSNKPKSEATTSRGKHSVTAEAVAATASEPATSSEPVASEAAAQERATSAPKVHAKATPAKLSSKPSKAKAANGKGKGVVAAAAAADAPAKPKRSRTPKADPASTLPVEAASAETVPAK